MQISTGKIAKAQKVVIYGPEGIGKTCLAASFPNPLFIDLEGGTMDYDVRRIEPAASSWSMLMGYIDEVKAAGTNVCSTLVLDTADWAERLCFEHVIAAKGATSIEDFGWGKGYTYAKEEFARMLNKLSDLIELGINVVVCAHAQISKFEQPDELGTYDRWAMKLDRRDAPLLKEWADMVLFCNYKTIIVKPDKNSGGHAKAAGGKRVMYTQHTPAWDAKNRVGLAEELPMDYSAIAEHFPASVAAPATATATTAAPAASVATTAVLNATDVVDPALLSNLKFEEVADEPEAGMAAPAPDVSEASSATGKSKNKSKAGKSKGTKKARYQAGTPDHLKPLYDLMAKDDVSEQELQSYCGGKGYCTADTPISVYPEDFCAFLVSDWNNAIKDIRVPFNV